MKSVISDNKIIPFLLECNGNSGKRKAKKILHLLTNIRSRKTKRILKLKKTVVFQTMSTKKPPILTFLPTSNSSFKLTE